MLLIVLITGDVNVLFVSVSVVARPTNVSVDVGSVSVPVLLMLEITGAVRVLLVSVCVPVSVVTVESIAKVTALPEPDVSIPVPPVKVSVSLSRSILSAPLSHGSQILVQ